MHPIKILSLTAAAVLGCTTISFGQGAPKWGTQTLTLITDVNSGGGETNPSLDLGGGAGAFFNYTNLNELRGIGESFAALQIQANQTPIVKGRSVLSGNVSPLPGVTGARVQTGAFTSEIFQYTGANSGALQLTFSLDGLVSDIPADSQTFIKARVAVFNEAGYQFEPNFDTLVFELGATP